MKQLEAPALSPDGKWVAYVVRSIEPKQRLDSLVRYEEFSRRYVGEN